MDKHTPEQRRYNMSQVKSKNTMPERILMKALRDRKIYFTHHRTDVFGKPDIVFKRKKVAVFIDSAFWHGKSVMPKTNKDFWETKLQRNYQRDSEVNLKLTKDGWTVLRLEDKEVKKSPNECVNKILIALNVLE